MLRADGTRRPMISAFGEILDSADWADGARPPLSGTHYGLQRQCGAKVGKRSSAFGSPAELASPMRLGSMSAHRPAGAGRTAHIKGKAVWETVAGQVVHRLPSCYPPNPQGR